MNSKSILLLFLAIFFCVDMIYSKPQGSTGKTTGKGMSKPTCSQPSKEELEESLSAVLSSSVIIQEYHFSCLAVRAFDRYFSLAVIVSYRTDSTDSSTSAIHIAMECNDDLQWVADINQLVVKEDVFHIGGEELPATQTQCYKCVSEKPRSGPGSENGYNQTTWCLECSENCKKMGGGFCVSPSTYSCCPYFTKYEGVCTEECNITNSTNHCTEECEGNWTGPDCKECSLECLNGGTPSSITCESCICPAEFTGTYCEESLPNPTTPPTTPPTDPPTTNPTTPPTTPPISCDADYCFNNGVPNEPNCSECICPPGFTGTRCEEEIDPCHPNPCLNGGTCIILEDTIHSCECPSGWTGIHCEREVVDPCIGYCKNGGKCTISDDGEPVCDCSETSFTGLTCENTDRCRNNPCENGGTCIDNGQSIECQCPDGYTGPRCEEMECPCLNGGSCEIVEGEMSCFCPDEFLGPLCQYPNPCIPNPCLNGGTCAHERGVYDSFTCTCHSGWTGATCDTCIDVGDFNECIQPTEDLQAQDNPTNKRTGLIIGITVAVMLVVLLVGSLVLLGVMIYRRFERIQDEEKSTDIDKNAFDGSKVMDNPVFIRPDDLSIEESMNTKIKM